MNSVIICCCFGNGFGNILLNDSDTDIFRDFFKAVEIDMSSD